MMSLKATAALVTFALIFGEGQALAGLLETRSNYVGSDWSGSWTSEANWAAITPYSAEPGDGGGDINFIAMANDNTYLYIYFNQASFFSYGVGDQNIYFDTDLNASTGNTTDSWWWNQPTGVGAEHSMYGAAIFHAAIGFFNGDWVDNWTGGTETGDILIQISLAELGNPAAFNFTARMFGTDDYYPNAGNHHQYVVGVPEPAAASMLALGGLALVRRRVRRGGAWMAVVLVGATAGLALSGNVAHAGQLTFSGRTWTTQAGGSVTPVVYTGIDANSASMRGSFGDVDAVMLTPITVSVGDTISYDYYLTNNPVDLLGDGPSTWFTDSSTYFGLTTDTFDTPWASRRLIVFSDDRWNQQLQGQGAYPTYQYGYGEPHPDQAGGLHVEWEFTSATSATVNVWNPVGGAHLVTWVDDSVDISLIQSFRVGLYDSEQTVTLANFLQTPVPEPASLALLALGGPALVRRRRRLN